MREFSREGRKMVWDWATTTFNGGDEQRMVGGKVAIEELDLGDCLTV
jgi:hypothetical protein